MHKRQGAAGGATVDLPRGRAREEYETEAHRAKRLVWVWSATEIVVSALVGVLAGVFFKNKQVAQVLSVGIPFMGTLLALSYVVFERHIDAMMERELKALEALGEEWREDIEGDYSRQVTTVVRTELSALHALLPFVNSYFRSAEKDRYGQRDAIVANAFQQLEALDRGEIELEDGAYYEWLRHRLVDDRPNHVRAISRRPLEVYHQDRREINFIKNNEDAATKGTQVTRIFIAKESDFCRAEDRAVLRRQFAANGVTCYVVWEGGIPAPTLRVLAGGGLSIYDDEDLFFDRSYLERTVGEAGARTGLDAPLRPRATVFAHGHPKFRELAGEFEKLLNDHVLPAHRTMDNVEVLKELLQELARYYGGREDGEDTRTALQQEIDDIAAHGL